MNIYLVPQSVNSDYDTYDSAVVVAEDEQKAKMTHPGGHEDWDGKAPRSYGDWCDASDVFVELVGTAEDGAESGVVCASFNAG